MVLDDGDLRFGQLHFRLLTLFENVLPLTVDGSALYDVNFYSIL